MKKSIIYMMAAAAMLTACSQEDLGDSKSLDSVDLSDRISLGNVELGAGVAESRGTVAAQHNFDLAFQAGDAVGAVLIDRLNTSNTAIKDVKQKIGSTELPAGSSVTYANYQLGFTVKDASKYYDIDVNQIYSNYEYAYNADTKKFKSEATLVEGNYLFYSPFDQTIQNRDLIKTNFPTVQDCSFNAEEEANHPATYKGQACAVSTKALRDFYSNNKGQVSHVGYKFLAKDFSGKKINASGITLKSLYSTPMITVSYPESGIVLYEKSKAGTLYTGKLTIEKVIVYDNNATDRIFSEATIDNKLVAAIGTGSSDVWNVEATNKGQALGLTKAVLVPSTPASGNIEISASKNFTQMPYWDGKVTNVVKKNVVTCNTNATIEPGKMYHFNAILPADDYTGDLKAKVYVKTEDGTRYVLSMANVYQKTQSGSSPTYKKYDLQTSTPLTIADYTFEDPAKSPGAPLILLRGWNIPSAELNTTDPENPLKKSFAGQMMTINIGKSTEAGTDYATVVVGFKLHADGDNPPAANNGFTNTDDFVNYLQNEIGAGINLTEDSSKKPTSRDEWGDKIAFESETSVTINAKLIRTLKQSCYQRVGVGDVLTLTTNLPIAGDVKVENTTTDTYKFTTDDGGEEASYTIVYSAGVNTTVKSNKIKEGLNVLKLTADAEIKNDLSVGGIILLSGDKTLKLTNVGKINRVVINNAASTLNVAKDFAGIIESKTGKIITSANLTGKNDFAPENAGDVTITNNSLKNINFKNAAPAKVTVKANLTGFSAIPTAANVNDLKVTLAGNVPFTTTEINNLAGLRSASKVNVVSSVANTTLNIVDDITIPAVVEGFASSNTGSEKEVKFSTSSENQLTITFAGIKQADMTSNVTITVASAANILLKGGKK